MELEMTTLTYKNPGPYRQVYQVFSHSGMLIFMSRCMCFIWNMQKIFFTLMNMFLKTVNF